MPHTLKGRRTLLPLAPATLQGELFRLDVSGEQPTLLVERELGGDWQAAAASPTFESLVYPQVLRSLISELLKDGWPDGEADSGGWQVDWVLLLENLPGFADPPDDEIEYPDWIDTVVEAFCRDHRMCEGASIKRGAEDGDEAQQIFASRAGMVFGLPGFRSRERVRRNSRKDTFSPIRNSATLFRNQLTSQSNTSATD